MLHSESLSVPIMGWNFGHINENPAVCRPIIYIYVCYIPLLLPGRNVKAKHVVISSAFLLELFYVLIKILVSAYFVNSLKRLDI